MKILAIDKILSDGLPVEGPPSEELTAAIEQHFEAEKKAAGELYATGIIREMYFRADRTGEVFVLECDNVYEARKALDTLPLVKEGLIDFEIIPLGPFA